MKEFLNNIFKYKSNFKSIKLGYTDKKKIEESALKLLNARDLNQLRDRFEGVLFYKKHFRQLASEMALEKLLASNFIDWDKKSSIRDYPCLIQDNQIKIGITSIDFGDYPILVEEPIELPQIFTIIKGTDTILICGYASLNTMNQFSEILSKSVISTTRKAIFNGFEHLKYFSDYEELKCLYLEN